jgi:hypothetical protein
MGEGRKVYKILVGKLEEKRPFGKQRRRWDHNGSWGDWLGVWIGFDWLRIGTGGGLL